MNMQRREFGKKAVLGIAAMGALGDLTGCPTAAQWEEIALADLPTLLQVIEGIIAIAKDGSVPPALEAQLVSWTNQITNDITLSESLISQYQAKASSSLLSEIDAALLDAQTNLNALLSAFHVTNASLVATVAASIGLALTVVIAIQASMPPPPAATTARLNLHVGNGENAIKAAFNEILAGHYPNAVIK